MSSHEKSLSNTFRAKFSSPPRTYYLGCFFWRWRFLYEPRNGSDLSELCRYHLLRRLENVNKIIDHKRLFQMIWWFQAVIRTMLAMSSRHVLEKTPSLQLQRPLTKGKLIFKSLTLILKVSGNDGSRFQWVGFGALNKIILNFNEFISLFRSLL